jgi:hypothetical protein
MPAYQLGPSAYRVTKKYELTTITAPLFDLDFLKVDFAVEGVGVTGMGLRHVGADMDLGKILTYVDPDLPWQGATDVLDGTIRMIFHTDEIAANDVESQALVVHEAVHAAMRRKGQAPAGLAEEAACYLAQALYFHLNGESIVEDWAADNPEYFDMPWVDDPYQADAKARIYVAAQKVIDAHSLATRSALLTAAQVKDLTSAIARDPGYAPHAPKNTPTVNTRPKTLLQRLRERRRKRRAERKKAKAKG